MVKFTHKMIRKHAGTNYNTHKKNRTARRAASRLQYNSIDESFFRSLVVLLTDNFCH